MMTSQTEIMNNIVLDSVNHPPSDNNAGLLEVNRAFDMGVKKMMIAVVRAQEKVRLLKKMMTKGMITREIHKIVKDGFSGDDDDDETDDRELGKILMMNRIKIAQKKVRTQKKSKKESLISLEKKYNAESKKHKEV